MQSVTPFLWFDNNAEDAARFYTSLFKDSRITEVTRNGEGGPGPSGSAMMVTFQLMGREYMALNGGPHFKFTEAFSMFVSCDSQAEVDVLWDKLCQGGAESQCGWLKDRFGLSWQIVPKRLMELMSDKDPVKSARVMEAMLKMAKIDVAALERAYLG